MTNDVLRTSLLIYKYRNYPCDSISVFAENTLSCSNCILDGKASCYNKSERNHEIKKHILKHIFDELL